MTKFELFGTASCPYTREMREWLEWRRRDFIEYDVERDQVARERLRAIAGEVHVVPILLEDERVVQVGWQGRGCSIG